MGNSRGVAGGVGLIAAAAIVAVWAGPAAAHVEVSADNPQAGATDVTLSFLALSEHDTEGIVSLEVVLPPGIASEDVSWVSGPPGWELAPSQVEGEDAYTVAGPEVPPGEDVAYQVLVARLPADATELAFRTLQTYSGDHVDRWIELPQPGVDLQAPAPVLTLTPAATPTSEPAEATPTVAASTPPATPATSSQAPPAADDGSTAMPWIIAVLVLVAAAAGVLWWRRHVAANHPAGEA